MRKPFSVTTKAAIFNHDKTKVLVISMNHGDFYGLPGGHIENNEAIEAAMRREIFEECGAEIKSLKKVDFFFHANGKIVLAFLCILKSDNVASTQNNLEGIPIWLSRKEFDAIAPIDPGYRKLVLDYWI